MNRWRGLKSLIQDAVEHGSLAVERLQLQAARRPFAVLALIARHADAAALMPPLSAPVQGIHEIHDTVVHSVHVVVRLVNRVVGATLDTVLDAVDARRSAALRPTERKALKGRAE